MDFYSYYLNRLGWGSNPYVQMTGCKNLALKLLGEKEVPFRISVESAAGLLAALRDWAGEGCPVSATFSEVLQELTVVASTVQTEVELTDQLWCKDLGEVHPDDAYHDAPGYFTAEDDDSVEDEAGNPDGGCETEESEDLYDIMKKFYDGCDEAETKGVRRPYPDWEHWASWSDDDWIKFEIYKKKMLAAAACDFFAMGSVTNAIAAAKEHMSVLPMPRQVEVALWCSDLVDELYCGMENGLQELCSGSLYTPAGRATQKQLRSANAD